MNVLLTGASGFIGRHLARRLLEDGHRVIAVVRESSQDTTEGIKVVGVDLGIPGWSTRLPTGGIDAVMHLAQSRRYRDFPSDAAEATQINVASSVELANWVAMAGVRRFIFLSSGTVYRSSNDVLLESDACAPGSFYGLTKMSAELLLRPFSSALQIQIVRLFAPYGPGQRNAMIPNIVERFVKGEAIQLAQNVGVRINPIYIDDCVAALVRLLEIDMNFGSEAETINLGGDEKVDLRFLLDILQTITGLSARVEIDEKQPVSLVGSTARMHERISLPAMTPFPEGIVRTFDWLTQNGRF